MRLSLLVCLVLLYATTFVNSVYRGNTPSTGIAPDTRNLPTNNNVNHDLEQMMDAFDEVVNDVYGGVTVVQLQVVKHYLMKMSRLAIMMFRKHQNEPILFRTIMVRLISMYTSSVTPEEKQSEEFHILLGFLKAHRDTYWGQTEDTVLGARMFRMVVFANDEIVEMKRRHDQR